MSLDRAFCVNRILLGRSRLFGACLLAAALAAPITGVFVSADDGVKILKPTVTLPNKIVQGDINGADLGNALAFKIMVAVAANDEVGATIDNINVGDIVIVESASGVASFKSTSMKAVKAVVGVAGAVTGEAIAQVVNLASDAESEGTAGKAVVEATSTFTKLWDDSLDKLINAYPADAIKHGRRDCYGQDPGTGDYAKDEGGLVICMPECRGAIYATKDYYFDSDAKSKGRKHDYYSKDAKKKNVLFPCNVKGGLMKAQATQPGMINILAWDSKFEDNAGVYQATIVIIRANRPANPTAEELVNKLLASGPKVK